MILKTDQPVIRRKVVGIIQARMGSKRLPGKTMADISGKPLLFHVIERVKASRIVEDIIVATTNSAQDLPILNFANNCNIKAFAGSSEDVLDRFYQAAKKESANVIVRITADDPFKDPTIIDKIANHLLKHPELDYVSNTIEPTFPDGLDIEAFTFQALEKAWKEAKLPSEREHVTAYIWKNTDKFKIENLRNTEDLSNLRWTIDYPEDLIFAGEVYNHLSNKGLFLMQDILELLKADPSLLEINSNIERNIGYRISIKNDDAKS